MPRGGYHGRGGRRRIPDDQARLAADLHAAGASYAEVRRRLGLPSKGTTQRHIERGRALAAEGTAATQKKATPAVLAH